jgi:hypothetical protein
MTIKVSSAVKLSLWMTLFLAWIVFEETVIDRHGIWRYLPLYRFANLCIYDISVAALLAIVLKRLKFQKD